MTEQETIETVEKPKRKPKPRNGTTPEKATAFARALVKNDYNGSKAMAEIQPGLTKGSRAVAAHRLLRDGKVQKAIAIETGKILSPEQVQERISALADTSKADRDRLTALQLLARIHGLLIDRAEVVNHNIDENRLDSMRDQALNEAESALSNAQSILETPSTVGEGRSETGQPEPVLAHSETGTGAEAPQLT